jgi:glycosyltransferase involved in cell wall biosynthesis
MAAMLAESDPAVRFIVAGWGDLGPTMVEQVAAMGLGDRFRFAGFLRGGDVAKAYRMADVYVMPSVREPFGLTALEAVRHGASVVVSKTSGVAEVLREGALHVDHWDVPAMAAKVRHLLDHPDEAAAMGRRALDEADRLTWDRAAEACCGIYETLMKREPWAHQQPDTLV